MNTLLTSEGDLATPPSPPSSERRVYVVDDNSDVRRSLHFSLASIGIAAWPFVCAQDFLDQATTLTPDPILLDVRMPGMDGLQLLTTLRDHHVNWPVIMMSAHGGIPIAVQSIKLGAIDFLEKPFKIGDLEDILSEAYAHLAEATQLSKARSHAQEAWKGLTQREAQVLDLLMAGAANKAVAHELNLSVRTIEIHRGRALSKLKLKSLAQVVFLRLAAAEA